jgi:uncharacterized protein YceK
MRVAVLTSTFIKSSMLKSINSCAAANCSWATSCVNWPNSKKWADRKITAVLRFSLALLTLILPSSKQSQNVHSDNKADN